MNFYIQLPDTNLSLVEWFIKHKVSSNHMSLDMAICKAINSQLKYDD